eukprot:m.1529152 g.1529152  ORF g.1529152 m.1529152 type:complete len:108 (+) comp25238_c1_seq33:5393-5716(+)
MTSQVCDANGGLFAFDESMHGQRHLDGGGAYDHERSSEKIAQALHVHGLMSIYVVYAYIDARMAEGWCSQCVACRYPSVPSATDSRGTVLPRCDPLATGSAQSHPTC